MTRGKSKESNETEDKRSLFSTGIIILIIVALGFLAFDTISRSPNQQDTADQEEEEEEEQQQDEDDNNQEDEGADGQHGGQPTLPARHTVAQGESLWKLAQRYYNDGYKWTVIAQENNLQNPDLIHVGANLNIPKIKVATQSQQTPQLPTSYTVIRGDTLWELAQKYYGSGYEWYRIRDANAGKVGLLPNGRPLITPGSVLTIPTR